MKEKKKKYANATRSRWADHSYTFSYQLQRAATCLRRDEEEKGGRNELFHSKEGKVRGEKIAIGGEKRREPTNRVREEAYSSRCTSVHVQDEVTARRN